MKISLKSDVFRKFHPELKVAFIFVSEMDNKSKVQESKHLLKEIENLTRLTFHKDKPDSHDFIVPWTLAKLRFGKKAKHYQTSLEKVMKIVLKGRTVGRSDVLTNILNFIALKYLVPFGVDNYQKIDTEILFDVVKGSGRKGILGKLKKGDLFYSDKSAVLGTKLDYWKNPRTMVRNSTKSALVHFEILPPVTKKKMKEILNETVNMIEAFCGAKVKIFILDKKEKTIMV
jgi:DNA/RNA-binding domain of Phe-tRNA-synthetase-like protein